MASKSDHYHQTRNLFYGRRKGPTLSTRKKELLKNLLPTVQVKLTEELSKVDPNSLFSENKSDIWLEIGFGKGEHLAWQAQDNPGVGLIGCEPFVNGVAGLLNLIEENNLKNIKIYDDDARNLLKHFPRGTIGRVFLLHPDPWPKKRHEGRRFVSQSNLNLLGHIMKEGAELRVGTDHIGYARWTMVQLLNHPLFEGQAESSKDWKTPPRDWPKTRYQEKALKVGNESVHFIFKRRPRVL
jgi:tRNA (guanine-N7-)-methyltransferase